LIGIPCLITRQIIKNFNLRGLNMSWATTSDNIRLYYEEAGTGTPIVFVHEFGGDWRSWEPQMRHFSRRHRCMTFSARGFKPSDIPQEVKAYSQRQAVLDILSVMDAAKIERAHIVGLSMGGFATLHFGLVAPQRAHSLKPTHSERLGFNTRTKIPEAGKSLLFSSVSMTAPVAQTRCVAFKPNAPPSMT
jgi:hypothetical protein